MNIFYDRYNSINLKNRVLPVGEKVREWEYHPQLFGSSIPTMSKQLALDLY